MCEYSCESIFCSCLSICIITHKQAYFKSITEIAKVSTFTYDHSSLSLTVFTIPLDILLTASFFFH